MEHIGNVINVRKGNISNNVNNVITTKKKKYALDRNKFTPNTEETILAEEIAQSFNDLDNYAFYLKVVNKLGSLRARRFWITIEAEIKEKEDTKYPIRNRKKYFTWKFKKGLF